MVFTSALGNYRDRNSVYHSLKRFTKGTEFESLTLHQLRHCNATLLLNSGVDLKVVSEHLGHCDIGVTANIYADVLKSTKAKVADLVTLKLRESKNPFRRIRNGFEKSCNKDQTKTNTYLQGLKSAENYGVCEKVSLTLGRTAVARRCSFETITFSFLHSRITI